MMTITEFLEARIAEDEAAAERGGWHNGGGTFANDNYGCLLIQPARVLAECAAKRVIVSECRPGTLDDLDCGEDDQPAPMWVARALAAVYVDHPDYNPEWAL